MSSGRDVWMESWNNEMTKREEVQRQINNLDTPYEITYFCRVNEDKITWGYMKQIDDNLKIIYNTNKKSFTVQYL